MWKCSCNVFQSGSRLEDLYEKIEYESQGDKITPLVTNPGRIMLTSHRLYFQPFNNVDRVGFYSCFELLVHVLLNNASMKQGHLVRGLGHKPSWAPV